MNESASRKINPVIWFEIYVKDMPRARAFYEQTLGLTLAPLGNPNDPKVKMMGFPSGKEKFGANGALVQMEGVSPGGGCGTLIYFACEDCAVEAGRIEAAGGKVHRPKFAIGEYGFIALGTDTEGNLFGLHSMK